ncbi:hypothetical protein GCM10011594_18110 [Nakamurella endophytica]|uniref:Uncharacterized protein n=1 Tax=Nakamurella endophytica TaxID=1748367 RepID=A0A917SU74_9ACTN|nr:hypothetical protein GCM10011594_18110 [Nakamurella endophytica]
MLAWARQHLPPGAFIRGSGTTTTPTARADTIDIGLGPVTLLFTATATPTGSAVRADAQMVWVPRKSAGELIPATVTSVDIAVQRGSRAAAVRRVLGAAAARRLAAVVNATPVLDDTGERSCPADLGGTDSLVFRARGAEYDVTVAASGCGGESLRGPAGSGHWTYGQATDAAALRALGLPEDYGNHF